MMTKSQGCWFVCNDTLFQTAKWLLSTLAVVVSTALVLTLELG